MWLARRAPISAAASSSCGRNNVFSGATQFFAIITAERLSLQIYAIAPYMRPYLHQQKHVIPCDPC